MTSLERRPKAPAPLAPAASPAGIYLRGLSSPKSRDTMERSLRRILEEIGAPKEATPFTFPWWELRFEHTSAIREALAARFAPATVRMMLAALRGVLKTASLLRIDLPDGTRAPLLSQEELAEALAFKPVTEESAPAGRMLSADEIARMRSTACAESPRDCALVAVFLATGLRRFEIATLELAHYSASPPRLRFPGKRGRWREIPLVEEAHVALKRWLQERGGAPGPLFQSLTRLGEPSGRALTVEGVRKIVERIRKLAKVKAFTLHDFRRTVISQLWDMQLDPSTIQRIAGHKNIATSAIYDHRDDRAARAALEQLGRAAPQSSLEAVREAIVARSISRSEGEVTFERLGLDPHFRAEIIKAPSREELETTYPLGMILAGRAARSSASEPSIAKLEAELEAGRVTFRPVVLPFAATWERTAAPAEKLEFLAMAWDEANPVWKAQLLIGVVTHAQLLRELEHGATLVLPYRWLLTPAPDYPPAFLFARVRR